MFYDSLFLDEALSRLIEAKDTSPVLYERFELLIEIPQTILFFFLVSKLPPHFAQTPPKRRSSVVRKLQLQLYALKHARTHLQLYAIVLARMHAPVPNLQRSSVLNQNKFREI